MHGNTTVHHTRPVVFLFMLLVFCSFQAMGGDWSRINPGGGGAFTAVGVGPTGTVVVGSDLGGAYISQDEGGSWNVIGSARGMTMTHVQSVAMDPADAGVILLGGEYGIFRSSNAGSSFTLPVFQRMCMSNHWRLRHQTLR